MRDSQTKLVLFNELRRGPLTGIEASLFPVRVRTELVREGIAKTSDDGGLTLVNPTTYTGTTPPTIPPPASGESGTMVVATLPTLTARVPQEVLDYLDGLGFTSRSIAAREVLVEAVAKGLGKPANLRKAGGR